MVRKLRKSVFAVQTWCSLLHLNPASFSSGSHGIICLEDLIHEIYSVGKSFRAANNFLVPFKLSVARHAARDKAGLLKDLGNPGFRGAEINSIIRQLNWEETDKRWTFRSNLKDSFFCDGQNLLLKRFVYHSLLNNCIIASKHGLTEALMVSGGNMTSYGCK